MQIFVRLWLSCFYHEVLHFETLYGIMHRRILLLGCEMTFEPFQIDYQNRWSLIDLNLLDCLFMLLALVAVPFILPRQFLRSIELPEAVWNRDFVDEILVILVFEAILVQQVFLSFVFFHRIIAFLLLNWTHECRSLVLATDQEFIETPAVILVELHSYLKIEIIIFILKFFHQELQILHWRLFSIFGRLLFLIILFGQFL